MSKNKTRRLWLQIKWSAPGVDRKTIRDTLIRSIKRGDYRYPPQWRVAIGWSNKPDDAIRWGEFRREMEASRASSPGFDAAVLAYLENQE